MANVRHFGARGDGRTDDTAALSHAVQNGDGLLELPRGTYVLSRPLYLPLDLHGRIGIDGQGGTARLLMTGPGPALHIVGTHRSNADPANVAESVWNKERFPTVQGLEIVGAHPEADGIRIEGAMQPTLLGVLIRRCRHGVHLLNRDRNVLIAHCHIYQHSGVGVFLDRLNLHQVIITGSHISYCKQGGIKIVGSEIRNLQICGNDIEYNYDINAETSADVLFDCRAGTIREGTLVGNTIQARQSPRGANVRLLGVGQGKNTAVGMLAISGNLLGSQLTTVHLESCRGISLTGNCLYNGTQHALWADGCEHIVIGPNSIDHNPDYKANSTDRIVLQNCRNVTLTGLILQHTCEPEGSDEASLEISGSQEISVTGCHLLGVRQRGVWVRGSSLVRLADCTIRPADGARAYRSAVAVDAQSNRVLLVNNFLGKGSEGAWLLPKAAGTEAGNLVV